MKSLDNELHIALAFDQKFIVPLFVLLTSIFTNNKDCSIIIHAIATGISNQQKQEISEFVAQNNAAIHYYAIDEKYVASFATFQEVRYGLAAFYRLLLPGMLPLQVSKVLYMDIDIVVVGSLVELYATDITQFPVAAVPDPVEWDRPDLGIMSRADYFNSGVLLINIPLWREQKISEKAIRFLKDYPEKATYVDQDALNAVLIGNWLKLDDKFNFTYRVVPFKSRKELRIVIKDKVIIHYNQSTKPWHRTSNNKLDFLYHEYFKLSPLSGTNAYHPVTLSLATIKRLLRIRLEHYYFNVPYLSTFWQKAKK